MNLISVLLLPFAFIYSVFISLVRVAYSIGVFKSEYFDIPVISVGNLSMGGTGKSPHVEYLVDLLAGKGKIATLSRGYGRKSKGFKIASPETTVYDIGDEPMLFYGKHPDLLVCVDANRVRAVRKLQEMHPELKCVILDDAFQHRAIKPGLKILLTDYSNLYIEDYLFPAGTLRDHRSASVNADIIIVTKCPDVLSPLERRIIVKKLDPLPHQHVYFSFICYDDIHPFFPNDYTQHPSKDYYFREHYSVLLVTGIANPTPLIYHIKPYVNEFLHIKFRDHHWYTSKDIQKIRKTFNKLGDEKKIILTTEKDIVRLQAGDLADEIRGLPLFYIPIRIDFHDSDINEFKKQVVDYVERTYRNI